MTGRPSFIALSFLALVRLVVNTGTRFAFPFLPAIARGLDVSLERAGFLLSVRSLAGLGTPLAVRAAGAGERRARLIAGGMALFAVGAATTVLAGVYVGALVGFALMGLAKPLFDVGALSYLADRSPYEVRARYLSITELTWAGGLLVGAPAAGWLISRYGWEAPFWAVAALSVVALGAVRWTVESDTAAASQAPGRLVLNRAALWLLTVMAVFSFAADSVFVVFGAWLEDSFRLSLLALGVASMVIGLAELAGEGGVLAFTDRLGKRRAVALGLVVAAAGHGALLVTGDHLIVGLGSLAVAVVGFELTIVSALPLATEVIPAARSRFLALTMVALGVGRAGAAAVAPTVFGRWGLPGNALLATGCELLALWMLLRAVPEQH